MFFCSDTVFDCVRNVFQTKSFGLTKLFVHAKMKIHSEDFAEVKK